MVRDGSRCNNRWSSRMVGGMTIVVNMLKDMDVLNEIKAQVENGKGGVSKTCPTYYISNSSLCHGGGHCPRFWSLLPFAVRASR